jgi:hypothetical protein
MLAWYGFFRREFFAFGKEVWSGNWLRPAAARGNLNIMFRQPAIYPAPAEWSTA